MAAVLVDASGLIALLDRSDPGHQRCVAALAGVRGELATVWPALTEAMHLLRGTRGAVAALTEMVEEGALQLLDVGPEALGDLRRLMAKYADLPMDFADAALVHVAGRDEIAKIVTLDRHFTVYRLSKRRRFVVLTL